MKIKVGISARHVHLNETDFIKLFGNININDMKRNDLSQKGDFATNLCVTIKGQKNEITNVCVLGPLRNYTQVELSKTDCYKLGLDAPIRNSGDLFDASEITIVFNDKEIIRKACIVPTRHIHINPEEQKQYNLYKEKYQILINNEKGGILDNVYLKVGDNYHLELHLDTDDANANLLKQQEEVTLVDETIEKL